MHKRWSLAAGRVLCFDGREIATLRRSVDEHSNSEISPRDMDLLAHAITRSLNASGRKVKEPYHAWFCQRCGKRNLQPARACECGGTIMGHDKPKARVRAKRGARGGR